MNALWNIIHSDILALLALAGLLAWIGGRIVDRRRSLWPTWLAVAVGVLYAASAAAAFQPQDAQTLLWIGIRAILVASLAQSAGLVVSFIVDGVMGSLCAVTERRAQRRRTLEYDRQRRAWAERPVVQAPTSSASESRAKQPSFREIAEREKQTLEDRLAAIRVIQEMAGIGSDELALEELRARETEESLRRISERLGYGVNSEETRRGD